MKDDLGVSDVRYTDCSREKKLTIGNLLIVLGVLCAIAGVFLIPWYVPLHTKVIGESYSLGFSNKIAVVSLIISIVLIIVGRFFRRKPSPAIGWFNSSPILIPSMSLAYWEYLVLVLVSVICASAVLLWSYYLINPYWQDAGYYLSRIDLALLGYAPYLDFQFLYGPGMIYAPIILDKISGGYLGIEAAYSWILALMFVLGFITLFLFFRLLKTSSRDRSVVLLLTSLVFFYPNLQLGQTPLRYGIVPCALGLGCLLFNRISNVKNASLAVLVVSISGYACFLISPEMFIAVTFGYLACIAVFLRNHDLKKTLLCSIGISLYVLLAIHENTQFFYSIKKFGSGAYNFPIYPNVFNLTLVASALYILSSLGLAVLQRPRDPLSPMIAAFFASAMVLLPAAMGRCDPGHVITNEIILYAVIFVAVIHWKHYGRVFFHVWCIYFFVFFIAANQFFYWKNSWGEWCEAFKEHNFYEANPDQVNEWKKQWLKTAEQSPNSSLLNWHKVVPYPETNESIIDGSEAISTPMGSDVVIDRFAKLRKTYRPSYYTGPTPEIFTLDDVSKALNESLNTNAVFFIPRFCLENLHPDKNEFLTNYETSIHDYISQVLQYPVSSRIKNFPFIPNFEIGLPLMKFLQSMNIIGECKTPYGVYVMIRSTH